MAVTPVKAVHLVGQGSVPTGVDDTETVRSGNSECDEIGVVRIQIPIEALVGERRAAGTRLPQIAPSRTAATNTCHEAAPKTCAPRPRSLLSVAQP